MKNLFKSASCGNPAKFVWQEIIDLTVENDQKPRLDERIKSTADNLEKTINKIPIKDDLIRVGARYKYDAEFGEFESRVDKTAKQLGDNQRFEFNMGNKDITLGYGRFNLNYKDDREENPKYSIEIYLKVDDDFGFDNFTKEALLDGSGNEVRIYLRPKGDQEISVRINGNEVALTDAQINSLLDKVDDYSSYLSEKTEKYSSQKSINLKEENNEKLKKDKMEADKLIENF